LTTFSEIAERYLKELGYTPYLCKTEDEARGFFYDGKNWPCLFSTSDTTGEKDFEEFYTENESLDMERFINLGVIKNPNKNYDGPIDYFKYNIDLMKKNNTWSKQDILDLFHYMIPDFEHKETGKYLDNKM